MMNDKQSNRPVNIDHAFMMMRVLRRLESGKVDSFPNRLRSQKIQYFAQVYGVSPRYLFSLYLRGPYSTQLTRDLFALSDKFEYKKFRFISDEIEEKMRQLEKFIGEKSNRELEMECTLHWLMNTANFSLSVAKEKIVELKGATDREIESAYKNIKHLL